MVTIRFARRGAKKHAYYHIVVTDKENPRDGKFIEQIGTFDPRGNKFVLDQPKFDQWIKNGAIASVTVLQLVKRAAKAAPPQS